jgi:hypothetical protein
MSKRYAIVVPFCALILAVAVTAQSAGEAPQPSPEHQKLGYFVGSWTAEGDMKDNPMMPGGSFSTRDECEWFEGGFAVVCRSKGKGPMGAIHGLGIMTYSADQQAYGWYGVDNSPMAMMSVARGTVSGKTWTFHDEAEMDGTTIESRYVLEEMSPTSYSFKWEMKGDDGSWQTIMKGKAKKASS